MQPSANRRAAHSVFCLTLFLIAAATLAADEPKPIEPKEKIELFNGKDMDGWVSHLKDNTEAAKVWSVKDGLLLCVGKPNGYLRTEKSYANYKVTVEWRFAKAGNTGVLVHINGKDDKEMNKTTGGSLTDGQIGIQCEGAQLEVRKVTLESLAP